MARTKVYPNAATASASPNGDHLQKNTTTTTALEARPHINGGKSGDSVVLTVWKKSLLLNCDGFTVFDAKGNLVFRVDNYIAGGKGQIILMDPSGKSLLTIRRKKWSLAENWLVFEGEGAVHPRYSVRKLAKILNSKSLAQVSTFTYGGTNDGSDGNRGGTAEMKKRVTMMYEIEGSYAQRSCAVYDDRRGRVAEIKRKEAVGGVVFGLDVFRLIVHEPAGIDPALAMALVIILDYMFGSSFIHFQL